MRKDDTGYKTLAVIVGIQFVIYGAAFIAGAL
jgi:hypothetical protein